jgi:hypothetical protein
MVTTSYAVPHRLASQWDWLTCGKSESADEVIAIVAGGRRAAPARSARPILSRSIMVREQAAWDHLTRFENPLNLIAARGTSFSVAQAIESGHRAMVPLGASDSEARDTIAVPRLDVEAPAKELAAKGLGESRARAVALLARRSVRALRRLLALRPETQRPAWARAEEAENLKGFLLACKLKGPRVRAEHHSLFYRSSRRPLRASDETSGEKMTAIVGRGGNAGIRRTIALDSEQN